MPSAVKSVNEVSLLSGLIFDQARGCLKKNGKIVEDKNVLTDEEMSNIEMYFGFYSYGEMINFFGWEY